MPFIVLCLSAKVLVDCVHFIRSYSHTSSSVEVKALSWPDSLWGSLEKCKLICFALSVLFIFSRQNLDSDLRLGLSSLYSCLSLMNAGIVGVCCHSQVLII